MLTHLLKRLHYRLTPAGPDAEPCEVFGASSDDDWSWVLERSLHKQRTRGVQLPGFPSDQFQLHSVGSIGKNALHEADRFYRVVKEYARKHGHPVVRGSRVLDFGCGWGRMTRFFLKDTLIADVVGADVDPKMIQQCREGYARGRFEVVPAQPPCALPEKSFDVIYAYSVFSHLNEATSLAWAEELARLLKPGGLLLATTQGRWFFDLCEKMSKQPKHDNPWHAQLAVAFPDLAAARAKYDAGEIVHAATGAASDDTRGASFYGETLLPRAYVEARWSKFLRVVDFKADPDFLPQALIVMQRPKT